MRILLKIVLGCIATAVLTLVVVFCWFRFYTRDLPEMNRLAQFTPTTATQTSDPRLKSVPIVAISYQAIGSRLREALNAAGVAENDPSVLSAIYQAFVRNAHRKYCNVVVPDQSHDVL